MALFKAYDAFSDILALQEPPSHYIDYQLALHITAGCVHRTERAHSAGLQHPCLDDDMTLARSSASHSAHSSSTL